MGSSVGQGLLAGGALGTIPAGVARGAKGTPDQQQLQDTASKTSNRSSSTQQTTFGPVSDAEQALRDQSHAAYNQQQSLNQALQGRIESLDPLTQASLAAQQGIVSGDALGITPQEQQQIAALRSGLIDQGAADVNRFLDQRLRQVVSGGVNQGLRGQALGELQARVLDQGAQQFGDITRQANQIAAQQTQAAPYQRIAAQSPFIQSGMSLADQLRQNAFANQQALQSPVLLEMLARERLAGGRTTTSGTSRGTSVANNVNTLPGQPGGIGQAIAGGFGGAIAGANTAANLYGGYQNLALMDSLRNRI